MKMFKDFIVDVEADTDTACNNYIVYRRKGFFYLLVLKIKKKQNIYDGWCSFFVFLSYF